MAAEQPRGRTARPEGSRRHPRRRVRCILPACATVADHTAYGCRPCCIRGCRCYYVRLQVRVAQGARRALRRHRAHSAARAEVRALVHTVTGYIAYGCRPYCIRLKPYYIRLQAALLPAVLPRARQGGLGVLHRRLGGHRRVWRARLRGARCRLQPCVLEAATLLWFEAAPLCVLEPATCLVPARTVPPATLCMKLYPMHHPQVIEHGEVGKESQRTWLYELRLQGAEEGV